jgi:hypothetical protein
MEEHCMTALGFHSLKGPFLGFSSTCTHESISYFCPAIPHAPRQLLDPPV